MTIIQFAPSTPPGFRGVRRSQPVCGPRYPYQKRKSLRIWSTILRGRGGDNSFFSFLLLNFILFFHSGGHGPRAPPPPLGYVPNSRHLRLRHSHSPSTITQVISCHAPPLPSVIHTSCRVTTFFSDIQVTSRSDNALLASPSVTSYHATYVHTSVTGQ